MMTRRTSDLGDTPIDCMNNSDVSSKRKFGKVGCHGHTNCKGDSSNLKLSKFENHMFDEFVVDVDEEYRQYLIGDMMSILTDDDYSDNDVNDGAMDSDPQYEIFLGSLTVDGNSYVLQVNEKNGLSEPLKYDVEDGSDDELNLNTWRKMENVIGGNDRDYKSNSYIGSYLEAPVLNNPLGNQRKHSVVENDMRFEPVNSNSLEYNRSLDKVLGNGGVYAFDAKCMANVQGEGPNSQILRKSRMVNKGGKSESAVNVKEDDGFDDEYKTFCNCLNFDGNNLVLRYKGTLPIIYEADDYLKNFRTNNSTCSMKENAKLPACIGGSDTSVEGNDNCHYLDSPSRGSNSSFREQVMTILRKPFDSKEHQMLLQNVLARRPAERNMDLRFGRERSYTINKDGKSYLDHYCDFKRKLQAAKSSREELNLLRGFFFWLQNLTQEGAFRPWQNALCLAV